MSESCLNAGRGGRRGRERDSKALSRVCARRAARGARSPRAREGGGARPRGARRAPRARGRARAARCARRPPGVRERSAAAAPRGAPPGPWRGAEGAAREGGGRGSRPGRGAPARHGCSEPSASRERRFLRLGGLCLLSSQRSCRRRPAVRETPGEARPGGVRRTGRRLPGLGSKCRT